MLLTDKTVLVTGGTRGIGRAVCESFVAHGAQVVFTGLSPDLPVGLPAARPDLEAGPGSTGVRCDVSVEEEVDALVAAIVVRHGRLDVVVNNAGIARDSMTHRMELADFRAVLEVNLTGTWLTTRAALRHMRVAGGGAIVNIASISGKVGNLGQGNYAASKAGVVALTKTVAREGASKGIRANVINPGFIETDMTDGLSDDARARLVQDIPLGRPGRPSEVAKAALFLASDLSSYMTGAVLDVSGGRHM